MNPLVAFTVYGVPASAGSKTIGRNRDGVPFVRPASAKQKPWQDDVRRAAGVAMAGRPLLEGPLRLDVLFLRPRPKSHYKPSGGLSALGERTPYPASAPDTTKMVRAVEDGMEKIVLRNDAAFVKLRATKAWGEPACAMVEVYPA